MEKNVSKFENKFSKDGQIICDNSLKSAYLDEGRCFKKVYRVLCCMHRSLMITIIDDKNLKNPLKKNLLIDIKPLLKLFCLNNEFKLKLKRND